MAGKEWHTCAAYGRIRTRGCIEALVFIPVGQDVQDQVPATVFRVLLQVDVHADNVRGKSRDKFFGFHEMTLDRVALIELDHCGGVRSNRVDFFFLMRDVAVSWIADMVAIVRLTLTLHTTLNVPTATSLFEAYAGTQIRPLHKRRR